MKQHRIPSRSLLVPLAAAASMLVASSCSDEPDYSIEATLRLDHHSAVPADSIFDIAVSGAWPEEPSARAQKRAAAGSYLRLWDITSRVAVAGEVLPTSTTNTGAPLHFSLKPAAPLGIGHDYGVRIDPASGIKGRYSGTGGEFYQTSKNGELGAFYVGSRLRVWEIGFKGTNIYLTFSEPIVVSTFVGAVTLTNLRSGRAVAVTNNPPSESTAELTLFVRSGDVDTTAEHKLAIKPTVTAAAGSKLDANYTGLPGASDFELTLTVDQTDLFVNGPSRKSFLQMTCNHDMEWWSPEEKAPAMPHDSCRQLQ